MARSKRRPGAPASPAQNGKVDWEAWLDELLQEVELAPPGSTPLEQAQALIYRAWNEPDRTRRIELARQALDCSPDCADAWVVLAEEADELAEALRCYREGVAAGERVLGPALLAQECGRLWQIPEARPYLRARVGLAQGLWLLGEQEAALTHLWELLRLDGEDHLRVRYLLLEALLIRNDLEALRRLIDMYPDDGSAAWCYSRTLVLYRHGGDTLAARQALREARQANPHVPDYLLGRKKLPGPLPDYIEPGTEEEAIDYVSVALPYWTNTPGALSWLRQQVARVCRR